MHRIRFTCAIFQMRRIHETVMYTRSVTYSVMDSEERHLYWKRKLPTIFLLVFIIHILFFVFSSVQIILFLYFHHLQCGTDFAEFYHRRPTSIKWNHMAYTACGICVFLYFTLSVQNQRSSFSLLRLLKKSLNSTLSRLRKRSLTNSEKAFPSYWLFETHTSAN